MLEKQYTNNPELETEGKNQEIIEQRETPENNPNLIMNENIQPSIKSRLSKALIEEILRNPNLTEEERQKYTEINDQINRNKLYFIYNDLIIHDSILITNLKENQEIFEKEIELDNLHTDIDYDIELYKIGKKCSGMKKRYAIIRNGGIFSSNEPKDKIKDFKKLKDKSMYLQGAEIIKETKTIWEQEKGKSEWHNKNKEFRIRVNFFITPGDPKSKQSSFYLYFDNEPALNEVYLILLKVQLSLKDKEVIKENSEKFNSNLLKMKKFYTILKILSVKNKIKKRKSIFKKVENYVNAEFSGNLKSIFFEPENNPSGSMERKIETTEIINTKVEIDNNQSKYREINRIITGNKKNILFKIPPPDNFMPLISKVQNFPKYERSLNNLKNKYLNLKEIIPIEILSENNNNESQKEDICFGINQGIKVEKNNEKINNFKLDPEICKEMKFIYFDKNKPEIKFKKENNREEEEIVEDSNEIKENKNMNINILSDENIHEISNVIYKKEDNDENIGIENTLEIYGPKMSNQEGFQYKYKNKLYEDPELLAIKSKTINSNNNQEKSGFTFKIIQSEISITKQKILSLFQNITESIPEGMNSDNLKDKLLFGYIIKLTNLKKIKSDYIKPTQYENDIFFLEHNNQYFIPKEYIPNDIIIEYYCLPIVSFNGNNENEINLENSNNYKEIDNLSQFLSPVKIGYVKINYNNIESSNQIEYPIQLDDINIPNCISIIEIGKDRKNVLNLDYIEGKDYSIGGYSYLQKTINLNFINEVKANEIIPNEIKEKYFNIEIDEIGNFIYLRPNENMTEEEFKNDIKQNISSIEYDKIINNKKFNFIPFCEKYEGEKSLSESSNFQCLTNEQKQYIIQNHAEGNWIYKIPSFEVKLLTKNIGVNNEKKLTQYIFCTGEEKEFDLDKLTNDIYVKDKIIPIGDNCFNIFNKNEFDDLTNLENSNNYQWKSEIKFNNEIQMTTFLKLLILSRNNINYKWKKLHLNKKDYILEELFDFEHKKYVGGEIDNVENPLGHKRSSEEECVLNIEFIDFDGKFIIKDDISHIKFELVREPRKKVDILINYLENCKFKNTLLEKEKNRLENYFEKKIFPFSKKVKILKEKFSKGQKKIDMNNKMKTIFNYDFSSENDYSLIIKYYGQNGEKKEYFAPLNISTDNKDEIICDKYELPFYEKDNFNKIFGCIGLDIYEKSFEKDFLLKYEEINEDYFKDPYKIILEDNKIEENTYLKENYKFGLYEPNVFRRKILRKINDKIKIDPTSEIQNIPNLERKNIEEFLNKKCIKNLPDRLKDIQINFYEGKPIIINDEILNNNNYKNKVALKLLKLKRHQQFLEKYKESEWQIYLQENEYGNLDYFNMNNLTKENLLRNKNETDKLYNLIFLGIPNQKREIFYKIFLDTNDIYQKTKEKLGNNLINNQNDLLEYFSKDIENKNNIIFSLIDNDCSYLCSLPKSNFDKINSVKKIAKSFFIWAELKIGLENEKDRYVYFLGILYIIYKLNNYFNKENLTFLLLLGLSQKICHFKQQNPLFSENLNYINLFGLVSKLILEVHQKAIYEKFISLNFPIEYFISSHLSSLFADYFDEELMMRIFDILIFESGIEGKFVDNMQYLRILCAIPITLFELNKNDILESQSVSELESILSNLISHTLNLNKFKVHLQNNLENFYYLSGYFEEYIKKDEKRKWDDKREKINKLIIKLFNPIYLDNMNYLEKIKGIINLKKISVSEVFNNYFSKIDQIKLAKEINNCDTRIMLQISKLQPIYNNDNIDFNILEISFDKDKVELPTKELIINFDYQKNKIMNIQELFYEENFNVNQNPSHIYFALKKKESEQNIIGIATFSYNLKNCEFMEITNIVLENKEKNNKYILEVILYKDNSKDFKGDNTIDLRKNLFSPPKHIYSNEIEEELYSYKSSGFFFNNKLSNLIKNNNDKINKFLNIAKYDENKEEIYKHLNNITNKNNYKLSNLEILDYIQEEEIKNIIKNWISNSEISIEEILYSIVLVDKSNCINEKINLLYLIAQSKDRFLYDYGKDKLSTDKLKEMIYSLYKRYMVYFTKSDVNRMVDFLIKDERLFNIKYAFLYNKEDEKKINDFIHDNDRYLPKLNNKYFYEIYYDNITRQLNICLNYLNNYFNVTDIPSDILIYILTTILNNSENISKYIKNKLDKITLVIEKDNLIFKRDYQIIYSSYNVSLISEKNVEINLNQNNDDENMDKILFEKKFNLNTNNGYITDKYVNFDKFKKIFLKLPYLSDLLRVSVSYNTTNEDLEIKGEIKEFQNVIVKINYENDIVQMDSAINKESILSFNSKPRNYFNFYFPNNEEIINSINEENNNNNNYEMNQKIKISDTICGIIQKLINKLKDENNPQNEEIERCLKLIDKISCYVYYYEDENDKETSKQVKFGYFDSFYSCPILKEKNKLKIKIIFSTENFNLFKTISIKLKSKGYCKIFYNNDKDFIWKKIKLNFNDINKKGKVKCFNNYTPVLIKEDDYLLAYNL